MQTPTLSNTTMTAMVPTPQPASLDNISSPIFLGGDFNVISNLADRDGGSGDLSIDSMEFCDWIHHNNLIYIGLVGPSFTWARGSDY
ncbi:hypothetical protein V2J09_022741 [Rumex salicifolius]